MTAKTLRAARWLFLTFLFFFIGITRGHFQSTDEVSVFQQTQAMWERHDLDVTPMINTREGRGGRIYAVYNTGQSFAALPLYGLGKWLGAALGDSQGLLSGPKIGAGNLLWGGEVEIFAVNLLTAFAGAACCALFFLFSMQLGADPRSAGVAALLLGTSSHLAGFATCFFQHELEALCALTTFFLLFLDAQRPSVTKRALAGLTAGFGVLVRLQTLVLLPTLALYLAWNSWTRRRRIGALALEALPFLAGIALGMVAQMEVNAFKFGPLSLIGGYSGGRFDASLLVTWFGFFFSPGESLFIFTPLLVLLPFYWRDFSGRRRPEAFAIAGVAISYLLFYGKYDHWHGQWCFGPRYVVAIVPFLLLPLAGWWSRATTPWRSCALALAGLGVFVEVLHVSVNFSYVFHHENYEGYQPPFSYLFLPEHSQIAAHWDALKSGDFRVDMWLLTVFRMYGAGALLGFLLPLCAAVGFCLWRLRLALSAEGAHQPEDPEEHA
jgi:hypothetical protein